MIGYHALSIGWDHSRFILTPDDFSDSLTRFFHLQELEKLKKLEQIRLRMCLRKYRFSIPVPKGDDSLWFPQVLLPWLTASFSPDVSTWLGTCSQQVGNIFPVRWERIPNMLGIKFHHAENEWHSYVVDNKRLEGMFRRHVLIRLFFTGPFVRICLSASACLSARSLRSCSPV